MDPKVGKREMDIPRMQRARRHSAAANQDGCGKDLCVGEMLAPLVVSLRLSWPEQS